MMIWLRIFGLLVLSALILFGLWCVFVNLTGRENSMWFGGRPTRLGVTDGELTGPKATPNSVVSEGVDSSHPAYVAPLPFSGDAQAAMARLGTLIQAFNRVAIVRAEPDYVHAEFRSKTMGYVDDFEARLDAQASVIHVRSASRLGRGDKGVNRARIEMIRRKFAESQ
jgi:uncharacterized protein (DUF1499 family)